MSAASIAFRLGGFSRHKSCAAVCGGRVFCQGDFRRLPLRRLFGVSLWFIVVVGVCRIFMHNAFAWANSAAPTRSTGLLWVMRY